MPRSSTTSCHSAMKPTMLKAGSVRPAMRRRVMLPAPSCRLFRHRARYLFADQVEDALKQRAEFRRIDEIERARPRQVDRDHFLDAAGPGGHDDDLVAKQDRLVDSMRHEQHRFARRL